MANHNPSGERLTQKHIEPADVPAAAAEVHQALTWLANERRSWQEVTDAWRANPAAAVFEDLVRWTARAFARSMAMFVAEQDASGTGLGALIASATIATPEKREIVADAGRAIGAQAEEIRTYTGETPLLSSDVLAAFEATLQTIQRVGNDVLTPLGFDAIGRPTRRFYPNGMMRRPWLKADWRPCLFPARADLERAGEFWPILDFMSEGEQRAIASKMDALIEALADRNRWVAASPIRTLLAEHGLPSTDACVQFVKDCLYARGMDWRSNPPPIPPPID